MFSNHVFLFPGSGCIGLIYIEKMLECKKNTRTYQQTLNLWLFLLFCFLLRVLYHHIHIHSSESRWRNSQKGGLVRGYDKLRLMGVASHRSFPGGIHFQNTKKNMFLKDDAGKFVWGQGQPVGHSKSWWFYRVSHCFCWLLHKIQGATHLGGRILQDGRLEEAAAVVNSQWNG